MSAILFTNARLFDGHGPELMRGTGVWAGTNLPAILHGGRFHKRTI